MKKRIFSRILALVMAVSLLSTTAFAASFSDLQGAINTGTSVYQDGQGAESKKTGADKYKIEVSTNESGQRDVKLWEDVVYAGRDAKDYATYIGINDSEKSYSNVVIDLNGHKIDGGNNDKNTPSSGKNVFSVWGNSTLTVKDTTPEQKGEITGGSRIDGASGVYVHGAGATFKFESGNITGNVGNSAVLVDYGAHFDMSGGNITNNRCTTDKAGGVTIRSGLSSATITGGNISYNEGGNGGGINIYANINASNTISGVTMEGNTSRGNGGAVYIWGGDVAMDNLTIKDNKAADKGGAIWISEEDTTPWSHVSKIKYGVNNTISGNTASGEESNAIYIHGPEDNDYTISVDQNRIVSITDSEGNLVNAILDGNESRVSSGALSGNALEFHGEFKPAPVDPDDDDNDGNTPEDSPTIPDDSSVVETADTADTATTIEDEETPLAGLVSIAQLLEELRQYEGIEDIELPEDFQWIDHEFAQAIYWGLNEALVVDTEDDPLDPDEIVTVAILREVLENFVEYKGADLTVTVDGEDDMIVMDLGERLTVFYGELEAALEAQAA